MSNAVRPPKGEMILAQYANSSHAVRFFITSKQESREWYYLYEVTAEGAKKLGKAHTPPELEKKYKMREVCRK